MSDTGNDTLNIGIVGPCSAGKTTLIYSLREKGFDVRHIAQEHSYVPDMWQLLVHPDILVYLDVSYAESMRRRPLDMNSFDFDEQNRRLEHAREHADIYINTEGILPEEVLKIVEGLLDSKSTPPPESEQ